MSKRLWSLMGILVIAALALSACGQPATPEPTEAPPEESPTEAPTEAPSTEEEGPAVELPVRAAFVYIGPPGDLGWTYEHDRGRLMLEEELGDQVETTYIEDVPEGPDAARVVRQYAQEGWDVIFTTSFGYMEPTHEVAEEFPDVIFEHCSGYKTRENMATYFGRMYQPRYLSGIVAGEMTEENVIGYVAAFPIPEVIRGINAFTLGVRSVNPDAEVRVVWTNTWYDPVKEREAAEALLDQGADIITQHQDTTEPQKAAQERDALSIGYDSDMREFVGDTVLTSPQWNWGTYYIDTVQNIIDGTWETHQFWGGLESGIVMLAEMSPLVPDDVREQVDAERERILDTDWDVFCGPINDQDGSEAVADGECMSDEEMLNIDWFVEGVVGEAE
ncbi:MAG: BMP family ABC transporter substrate-binding protein [Anaerolineae bacterium]|nr:BMP family ABC transporter substrate-binding protein [Anaerolineae bacterium]